MIEALLFGKSMYRHHSTLPPSAGEGVTVFVVVGTIVDNRVVYRHSDKQGVDKSVDHKKGLGRC